LLIGVDGRHGDRCRWQKKKGMSTAFSFEYQSTDEKLGTFVCLPANAL
jgi:hypothetical protein